MRHLSVAVLAVALSVLGATGSPAFADDATETARGHYETGLQLFYARENAQALIEFQRAHEVKPRPATLFMMAQCEYLLGGLKSARDHYQAYLRESPAGEFVEVAKDRIESINRRPATLVINTVPDQVDVRIISATPSAPAGTVFNVETASGAGATPVVTGQAPNEFTVPRGRWTIAVSKPNYLAQSVTIDVDVADTKPLFFKLDPIPARLEIETVPAGATLWVNENSVRNPYHMDVPPGRFEIHAEAVDHKDSTVEFVLGPGDKRLLLGPNGAFRLRYVQRSGRPELVFASALMGGLLGAGLVAGFVAAAEEDPKAALKGNISSVSFTVGGALAGIVGGALIANGFVPSYIPDNRALFVIGGMWIGVAEGALTGVVVRQALTSKSPTPADPDPAAPALPAHYQKPPLSSQLKAAFIGSLPGIVLGTTAASLSTNRAPTYGRVALIQSAAVGGAIVGGLTAVAMRWNLRPWETADKSDAQGNGTLKPAGASILDLSLPALIGLNAGLAAGLLGAYLPDQSRYGPSWQRVALIDLAAGAGALIGGIGACIADTNCLTESPGAPARAHAAGLAVLGTGAGVLAGILLTRNVDREVHTSPTSTPPPSLTLLPMRNGSGGITPALSAIGFF